MLDRDATEALLHEVHRFIERAAHGAMAGLAAGDPGLSYPPDVRLSVEERSALAALHLSPVAASALQKVVADACSRPFFHFFCLLDGVGDPENWKRGVWEGVELSEPSEDAPDREMLHDWFFDTAPRPHAS